MTKIVVYHSGYGCDTGCCGHAVEIDDKDPATGRVFNWAHQEAGEDPRTFAERIVTEELGPEHVANLDWENCYIVEDH